MVCTYTVHYVAIYIIATLEMMSVTSCKVESSLVNILHVQKGSVCVCVCVCVTSLHTAKNVCTLMDIPIGFTLKSEDFQLADFSKTVSFNLCFLLIFGFLACSPHAIVVFTKLAINF